MQSNGSTSKEYDRDNSIKRIQKQNTKKIMKGNTQYSKEKNTKIY
jgi:hypothetical protein